MDDLCLATLLSESGNSFVLESIAKYDKCLSVPDGLAETLQELLVKKRDLKRQYLATFEEKLILDELLKNPQEWRTMKDAENKEEELPKAELERRLDKMMERVSVATEVLDTWRCKIDVLSQKVKQLKSKKSELQDVELSQNSLSLYQIEVKNKLEKLNIVLAAAQAEQDILKDRVTRMEISLQCLLETQYQLERKHFHSQNDLQSLKETLCNMQGLSGVECCLVNENTLQITLQPKNSMTLSDLNKHGHEDLEDCKFTADLYFVVNHQGYLELSDVQTLHTGEKVQELIENVKQDKDLPKFISSLRNTWISSLPVHIEVSCMRKSHAIDFRPEEGIVQLMIHKRNIVCTLNVPKSYPCAEVTLASIQGSDLTVEDILVPERKTLTAWVKHLEGLLGPNE